MLLEAAGLPPAFPQHELEEDELKPYVDAVRAILNQHEPYPAAALDERGKVYFANDAYRRLLPGAESRTAEEAIDTYYGNFGPSSIENWSEVAWAQVARRMQRANQLADSTLLALVDRATAHLRDVPKPALSDESPAPVVCTRFRIDGQCIETFSTVVRFEMSHDITVNELRIEMIFPVTADGAEFFRRRR